MSNEVWQNCGHMKIDSIESRQAESLVSKSPKSNVERPKLLGATEESASSPRGLEEGPKSKVKSPKLSDNAESSAITPAEVEPWENVVAGDLLLSDIAKLLRRFVVLPKWAEEAL